MVLDTRDLPRSPGSMRPVERQVPALAHLGGDMITVPEGADMSLTLELTSVSEGVLVSGSVVAPVTGECGRCLRPIEKTLRFRVQELFAFEDSTTDETTEEDEVGRLQGDLIDLEPTLRDAVVLALPANPLCRPDCRGLCQECGALWDDLPADHSHNESDPRWAALGKLTMTEE